ncbi:hypothetical protein [Sphingomonas sp.]|uniref:hypothetical protein n=1 Tax=Sphingomonas sp. TaxID=28214 RepID=UPI003CC526F0
MAVIGTIVFTGAMALASAAIWVSIAPQWRRIVRLAAGNPDQPFQPLANLARAEHRIAVRRWAAATSPVAVRVVRQLRAA